MVEFGNETEKNSVMTIKKVNLGAQKRSTGVAILSL